MSSLGKGLSALISANSTETQEYQHPKKTKNKPPVDQVPYKEVSIDLIEPNPFQPRMVITDESLQGLVESITQHGFFSPILVKEKGNKYIIIAGERRWRAAKIAGVKKIPVVINKSEDSKLTEMAIVENIQRRDLNPIEEAIAYDHLKKEYNLSTAEIAIKMGFSPEYIAHKTRLLKLPVSIQELVLQEKLSQPHTESLAKLGNEAAMLAVSKMVLRDRLSADKTDDLVQKLMAGMGITQTSAKPIEEFKQKYQYVVDGFKEKLGSKITLTKKINGGATLSITFRSEEEIRNFYSKIDKLTEQIDLDEYEPIDID